MWPILPPKNYFRLLVTPISEFSFVTDANLYLVFADVFVLVCISLLCVTKAFSVICHSHRQLLIHRKCTKWSWVHPLQCAWICAATIFLTWYQRESVTVDAQDQNLQCFKSQLQKFFGCFFWQKNKSEHCKCFINDQCKLFWHILEMPS